MKDVKNIIIIALGVICLGLGIFSGVKFVSNSKQKKDVTIDNNIVKPFTINAELNGKKVKFDYNKLFYKEKGFYYLNSSVIKGNDGLDYLIVINNIKKAEEEMIQLFIVNDKSEVLFDQQYKYPAILSDNNFKDKYNRYEKYPFNIVNNLLSVIQESINGDNKELLEYKFIIENDQVIVKKLILGDQYQIFVER